VTLESRIRPEVERELGLRIVAVDAVGGGCISPAYRLTCDGVGSVFLKTAPPGAPGDMLKQEALSLECIAATGTVRVPDVRAVTDGWLALEWLEPSGGSAQAWAALGRALARMHRSSEANYGWQCANFIGPLPQSNARTGDWASFWREQRLAPQLRRAQHQLGAATVSRFGRLLAELDGRLAGAAGEGPSLLHGDLWRGNVHFTAGVCALIDPSSCFGHREVDLAMAALFGGFPPAFLEGYSAEWPLADGARSRRPIYQLYYLLVHVNLFGGVYVAQTREVLETALA
jgi:protein-ribulosamine 3-kinase